MKLIFAILLPPIAAFVYGGLFSCLLNIIFLFFPPVAMLHAALLAYSN